MRNSWLKKLLPHIIAVIVFMVVALIYCRPALEGQVVAQHDITHWKGAIQQSMEYKERNGAYPLWTNSVFSGMPAFQIGSPGNNVVPWIAHSIISLGLPKPMNFFFLAAICFYFLCCVLGIRPAIGIMASLGFAYATYNPIIIAVGHDTKMLSIAYMPALLGSLLFIYEKKYWLGAGLTALFSSIMIAMNHPQIAYYFFLAVAIMTIFFMVRWIRQGEKAHLFKALAFTLGAGIIGVLTNAVTLLSTYEYQKATIRGGASEIAADSTAAGSQTGLDKDYAFSYSMAIPEPLVMVVPGMYGASNDQLEVGEEDSKAIEVLRGLPQQAQQFLFNFPFLGQEETGEIYPRTYWGGIGGTSGPPYVGAVICFLAILAFFVLDNKHKWWMLTAILLTVVMSWGSYFETVNTLFYKYLPLYNKFRAPSMILVIPQLLIPLLAALGLHQFILHNNRKEQMSILKKTGIATAILFAVLFMLYFSFDYVPDSTKEILRNPQLLQQPQALEVLNQFLAGLKEDRRSMFMGDLLRSFGFMAVAAILLLLYTRSVIGARYVPVLMTVLVLADLLPVANNYLNADNYREETENTMAFQLTDADREILKDTSHYRVYNVSQGGTSGGDRFSENITSYYYNSIGGYHPAKLRIYSDLIDEQLRTKNQDHILDMLNTKYLITKTPEGQTQAYQPRPTALGPAWFVKGIQFVANAREEMKAIDSFNPRDTAIVQEKFRGSIPFMPSGDSSSAIQLVVNDNDYIRYTSSSAANGFAVFSEIYYEAGWKAFIDGKEAPIVKVNYVLRGLAIPAGNHTIEFRFEPQGYFQGRTITLISSILLLALLGLGIFLEWRNTRQRGLANRA